MSVQFALDQRQRGIRELTQAIGIALRALVRSAQQQARVPKQRAIEPRADFQKGVFQVESSLASRRRLDLVPGIGARQLGAHAQLLLGVGLAGHQCVVIQGIEFLAANLDGVLKAVEGCLHDAFVGRVVGAELDESAAQFRGSHQRDGQGQIALKLELSSRLQARGRAGMAGNEHHLIGDGAVEIYLQVVGRGRGLVVLVGAQHREIERPARKLKIVGVAAE